MKTMIKLLRDVKDDDKLGPQEKACMNAVTKVTGGVGKQAARTDIIKQLSEGGELVTRQDPARILSFYQPKFKDKGLIEIVKVAEDKPKADPPKAAGPANTGASTPAKGTAPQAKPAEAAPATSAGA